MRGSFHDPLHVALSMCLLCTFMGKLCYWACSVHVTTCVQVFMSDRIM